jgi:hypothetical protein
VRIELVTFGREISEDIVEGNCEQKGERERDLALIPSIGVTMKLIKTPVVVVVVVSISFSSKMVINEKAERRIWQVHLWLRHTTSLGKQSMELRDLFVYAACTGPSTQTEPN